MMNRATTLSLRAGRIVLWSLLPFLGFGTQVAASAQPSSEARLQAVVERFFKAYQNKDLDGLMSMWSKSSPDLVTTRQKLGQIFTGTENIELKGLAVRRVQVGAGKASMSIAIEMSAVDTRTGKPARGSGRINRTFHFVHEGEEWMISRYFASEEELADALVQGKTESERNALLGPEKELVTIELVQALVARGRALADQAQYQGAIAVYQLGLGVADQLGDKTGTARALNSMGTTYYWQGDYAEALACYQKSLKLAEELGDKAQLASSLGNIGLIYDSQGSYSRAFEYYQKGLKLQEQVGNKLGIARALNNLGIVHRMQGNLEQALEYLHRSLKLKQELGNGVEVNSTLSNIGEVYTAQGNYTKASESLQQSLKMSQELKDKAGLAQTLGNLGILAGLQGNNAQALDYLQKNLELNQSMGDKAGIAATLNNLGELHFSQGRYEQAAELLDRAATLAKQIQLAEVVCVSNALAGRAYQAMNQPARARQSFLIAIDTIEELRSQVGGGEQEQQRSFENRLSAYHGMVDLLVEQNNAADALFYAERAKGRVLLDVLQSGRVNITKAMTASEQEKERTLRAEAVSLNVQLYRETMQQSGDSSRKTDLEARLQKARLEYEAFQTGLYAAHPELKVQRGRMQPLTMDQLRRMMPDPGTALLEFVVLKDKSFLFVLTGKHKTSQTIDLAVYTLPVKQKELVKLTQRFSRSLAERRLTVQELGGQLYDLLLKPARAQLKGLNALIIVPDDVLWQLPFQAVQPSRNRYLIEDYAISYAQSLTVLREIRQQPRQAALAKALPTLLAFGNPTFGPQTVERAKTVLMDELLQPLPETERQVKLLGELYGQEQSRIYTGSNAQEERFKAEAGKYRILHLATHGLLNDSSPMYSQLVLSSSQTNSLEDGFLEAWEIMNLDLRADLVVLSACETARGRVGAGEGIIGVSWALFVAGAPTAVVSQWNVESASSTELLLEFHRQIKDNWRRTGDLYCAAALRQAALKLLRSKQYDHPFYWAPFVIIGNGMGMPLSSSASYGN